MNRQQRESYRKLKSRFENESLSRNHNVVRFNSGTSTERHELAKAKICFMASKSGADFWTELKSAEGKIADIVILTKDGSIYIIEVETEKTVKKVAEKLDNWQGFEIFVVSPEKYENRLKPLFS